MNKRYCGILMALGCLLLAGCAAQPAAVDPADAVARLRTGQPLLSCREPCVGEWQRAAPQAAQLAAGGRWADLAALTLRIGYQDDLSLYYLGAAAEGLGFPGAASSYFRQSTYVSGTAIACRNLSRICGGMAFPQAAMVRLAAIERSLYRPRARRVAPAPHEREAPPPAEAAIAVPPPADAVVPAPPQPVVSSPPEAETRMPAAVETPAPAATGMAPAAAPARPPTFDYIEPPPAAR